MSHVTRRPSTAFTGALIATHVVIMPIVNWISLTRDVESLPTAYDRWQSQIVLLGIWAGISAAPLWFRACVSLTGLLWICAMSVGQFLLSFGISGTTFGDYAAFFRVDVLYLGVPLAASISAVALARTVWPRWRISTAGAAVEPTRVTQFSVRQLLFGTLACTPILLSVRLMHDHVNLDALGRPSTLLYASVQSPLPATIALLSIWAALSRTYVGIRLAVAPLLLLVVALLIYYALKFENPAIVTDTMSRESQFAIVLVTLLACRWNGYRIERVPRDWRPGRTPH